MSSIKRREFITVLGGAAVAWPLAARAQQPSTVRRIGFLGPLSERTQLQWTTAFLKGLRDHGWIEGTTISIDYRWAEGRSDRFAELRSEEHTSELQSLRHLVCRLLLEKKKDITDIIKMSISSQLAAKLRKLLLVL